MEKKTILEKLGLIEKVSNEKQVDNNEKIVKEQIDKAKIEKSQMPEIKNNNITRSNIMQNEVKVAATNVKDYSDPIAMINKKNLLRIEEIYKNYNNSTAGINSLYIVESFLKSLPVYLPTDIRRQSVLNIIASSNVNIENLLKDGDDKLRCLNDFSETFNNESNTLVFEFEKEIKNFTEKINNFKTAIDNLKKLHTEQDFTVKYEIEKINNILQFINPEK